MLNPLFHITDEPRILITNPFNRADPDDRRWWHVEVSTTRWRWIGQTREIARCLVKLEIASEERASKVLVDGLWTKDEPPYFTIEKTLREGDPLSMIPLVVRSEREYKPEVQQKAVVQANRAFITDIQFFAHGYTTHPLEPGQYRVTIRIVAGQKNLAIGTFWLHNPEKGVTNFVLSDNPNPLYNPGTNG